VQGHRQKGRARDVQRSREWGNPVAASLQDSQRCRFARVGDVGRAMHAVEGVPGQRCHARDVRVYRGHVFMVFPSTEGCRRSAMGCPWSGCSGKGVELGVGGRRLGIVQDMREHLVRGLQDPVI